MFSTSPRRVRALLPLVMGALVSCAFACKSADSEESADGGTGRPPGSGNDAGQGPSPAPTGPGQELTPRDSANILFSGHSLLDNPIPDWVEAIAKAKGDSIGWEQQNIGGSPIRSRTRGDNSGGSTFDGYRKGKNRSGQDRDILAELKSPTTIPSGQKYDALLITERHNPLDTAQWENSVGYLRHYHDRVAAEAPSATTYFYQCWPDVDKDAPEAWITYQTTELVAWECIASKVNLSLSAEGKPANVRVIPGSVALAELVKRAVAGNIAGLTGSTREKLDRIFTDDVHLAAAGQYLIAAVHYASVFGKSPVGAHAASELSAELAGAIEGVAWDVVKEYADSGAGGGRSMEDCRTRVAADLCSAYYDIRGQSAPGQGCAFWSGAQSPFHFPDDTLPLPAP